MPQPKSNNYIGERYLETRQRFDTVREHMGFDALDDAETDFIRDMINRLELYGERTSVSVRQLNWLSRIEGKLA
jgi:hypothetical protein